jgi:hypothetical protein
MKNMANAPFWSLALLVTTWPGFAWAQSGQPTSHAVLVGISRYQRVPQRLWPPQAAEDAVALRNYLKKSLGDSLAEPVLLTDQDANQAKMNYLDRELRSARTGDTVYIYLSGAEFAPRGTNEGFLEVFDSDPSNTSSMYAYARLLAEVKRSQASRVFLFLDPQNTDASNSVAVSQMGNSGGGNLQFLLTVARLPGTLAARLIQGTQGLSDPKVEDLRKIQQTQTLGTMPTLASLFIKPAITPPPPRDNPSLYTPPKPETSPPIIRTATGTKQAIEVARGQVDSGHCQEALSTLAGLSDPDQAIGDLRRRADACASRQAAILRFSRVAVLNTSVSDLHQALVEVQSALAKNPNDPGLRAAADELAIREQYASAVSQLKTDPDQALQGIQDFQQATRRSNQAIRQRLQVLMTEAEKTSKIAARESALRRGEQLYGVGNKAGAREILEGVRDDPRAADLLKRIRDDNLQRLLEAALRNGKAALDRGEWATALDQFTQAKNMEPKSMQARGGLESALAGEARTEAEAKGKRAEKLKVALSLSGSGLVVSSLALLFAFSPTRRRAEALFKLGWPARAARLYAKSGDHDRALRICRSRVLVKPEDNEIRRLAADIQFDSRDESGAADSYLELMRSGHGDEAMYARVLDLMTRVPDLGNLEKSGTLGQVIRGALRRSPDSPALQAALSSLYLGEQRTDAEALEVYAKVAARDGRNRDLLRSLAIGEYQRGHYTDAFAWSKQSLQCNATDPETISVLIQSGDTLGALAETLEFLGSLPLDGAHALSAYEAVADRAPGLRQRIQLLYKEKLNEVNGNVRERALIEAHIAIDEKRFREAELLLKAAGVGVDSDPARGVLVQAYRRIISADQNAPSELALELARLYGSGGNVSAAAELLSSAIRIPETQKAATSLLEEIYDRLPIRQLALCLFNAAGWTLQEASVGLLVTAPATDLHTGLDGCLVSCFNEPVPVAQVDEIRRLMIGRGQSLNRRFAFFLAPIRPRHEVYAFLYSLPSDRVPVWIIPLEAPAVRKALVRGEARDFLERELDLWRGRIDLYLDRDAITDPARFFGRERYFNELTRRITSHENFGIFGIRKIGKTSLAAQLRRNLPHELVGFADMQRFSSARMEEVYFLLIESLMEDARRKFPAQLSPVRLANYEARNEYPHVTSDFSQDVVQIARDLRAAGYSPRILLIIDEIELLVPYGESPGLTGYENFFRTLRGLHQMNDYVVSAIMGADPSVWRKAIWGARDNPVFQYYEEIFLTGFDRTECDAMIEGIGRLMGIEYQPECLATIYHESGGHPYVARQLASCLISHFPSRPLQVEPPMIEAAIEDYLSTKGDYFLGIFKGNSLSQAALNVLTECARLDDTASVSRDDLISFVGRKSIKRMELDGALQDLELFGLLVRERQSYNFKTWLMRRWIRRSWLGME